MKRGQKRRLLSSFSLSKKAYAFFDRFLRLAAAHEMSAGNGHFARLQAERYFQPRTCRGRKLDHDLFRRFTAKLYEVFRQAENEDRSGGFCPRFYHFSILPKIHAERAARQEY